MQPKGNGGGWNQGKVVGRMRPFTMRQVQIIRSVLDEKKDFRGRALFEVGISVALRAGDLLKLRVHDVMSLGEIIESFDVRQSKTGTVVTVDLMEDAVVALKAYILAENMQDGQRLFPIGRLRLSQIVKQWAEIAGADPRFYSTHSVRRTFPAHVYRETGKVEYSRQILGHSSSQNTSAYLGVEEIEVREVKKRFRM